MSAQALQSLVSQAQQDSEEIPPQDPAPVPSHGQAVAQASEQSDQSGTATEDDC